MTNLRSSTGYRLQAPRQSFRTATPQNSRSFRGTNRRLNLLVASTRYRLKKQITKHSTKNIIKEKGIMRNLLILLLIVCSLVCYGENWHYNCDFGVHYDIHAMKHDINLGEMADHESLKKYLEIMKPDWIHCDCKGHAGFASYPTEVGTPSPGIKKDALKVHSEVCHELGIPLGVHYSSIWDQEACAEHPEWAVVNVKGERETWCVCLNSDYFDKLMIPQMLEIIDKYDVDGFWIDGECWAQQVCYCDRCKAGFRVEYGLEAPTSKDDPSWRAWMTYHRGLLSKTINKYTDAVHKRKPSCLVAANWMLTYGTCVEDTLRTDYITGDLAGSDGLRQAVIEGHFVPEEKKDWNLMAWSMYSGEGPATMKTYESLVQECGYATACGASVMVYDTPARSGELVPWHCELIGKVGEFVKPRAEISRHSKSLPEVAVIHNPTDVFGRYEYALFKTGGDDVGKGISSLLSENHYHYDFMTPSMIKGKMERYKLIIINEEYAFDQNFLAELSEYLEGGGAALFIGNQVGHSFHNFLGVKHEGFGEEYVNVRVGDETVGFSPPYDWVSLVTAKPFKHQIYERMPDKYISERCIATTNEFGKGKTLGVYVNLSSSHSVNHYLRNIALFKEIVDSMGIDFTLSEVEAPGYVHFILREKDGDMLVNMINTGKVATAVESPKADTVAEIPKVPLMKFRVKVPKEPKRVKYAPTGKGMTYRYKDGYLYVTVKNFEVSESIIISL